MLTEGLVFVQFPNEAKVVEFASVGTWTQGAEEAQDEARRAITARLICSPAIVRRSGAALKGIYGAAEHEERQPAS
jgi:hypothetical protein